MSSLIFYHIISDNKQYHHCGDCSINRPIGFRIDSGLLGPWPIQGCVSVQGHHTPRQYASEDDRVRGRSGRGLIAIRSQN